MNEFTGKVALVTEAWRGPFSVATRSGVGRHTAFSQARWLYAIRSQLTSSAARARIHRKSGVARCCPYGCGGGSFRGSGRLLTINVGVLLVVIVLFRLRRRTESRSRLDEKFTVAIVLALGVLIAPTPVGQGILNFLGQLASGVTQSVH